MFGIKKILAAFGMKVAAPKSEPPLPTHATRQYIGWAPGDDWLGQNDERQKPWISKNWAEFFGSAKGWDFDLNLVADFYFCDAEDGTRELNLWLLSPRKGASRGVCIQNIQDGDLPQIREWLKNSWCKHQEHFAWVTG